MHRRIIAWNSGDAFDKEDALFTKHFSYFTRKYFGWKNISNV